MWWTLFHNVSALHGAGLVVHPMDHSRRASYLDGRVSYLPPLFSIQQQFVVLVEESSVEPKQNTIETLPKR